jgi:hypothetical protein
MRISVAVSNLSRKEGKRGKRESGTSEKNRGILRGLGQSPSGGKGRSPSKTIVFDL